MTRKMNILNWISGILVMTALVSCQQPGKNKTGSEYMPDMAHSVAYEANTYGYYYNNRWGSKDDLHKMVQPRVPLKGTIARGVSGGQSGFKASDSHQGIQMQANGAKPYYYVDTEEDRTRAMAEIIQNPYPITGSALTKGKALYNIYCGICHGEKADGAGYLVRDNGGKYPVQPANLISDEFIAASNGRFYHGIIYGKNLMSGYSDKLSYEERWMVIHYIRSLQAASKKFEYNENVNTLNSVDIPYAKVKTDALSKLAETTESIN
jgi:mono/diheme cytochrome c family protein